MEHRESSLDEVPEVHVPLPVVLAGDGDDEADVAPLHHLPRVRSDVAQGLELRDAALEARFSCELLGCRVLMDTAEGT